MPNANGTPSDIEVLEAALEHFAKRLRVHLPGTVEEVHLDAEGHARAVDVRVDVGEYRRSGGKEVADFDPVLPNVPIEWLGGGGARLTFPLQRGDSGLLLFMDRGLDEWKANASGQVVARALRRHNLTDAVFAPGLRRLAATWAGARTDAVTLGYEGAAGAEGMQVHIAPTGIALGEKSPVDAVLLGTTYRNADASFDNALKAAAVAFTAATAPIITALAPFSVPATPPLPADGKAVGAQVTLLITALNALTAAINSAATAKEAGASTYLSTTVKARK